jgi:DNA repair protein RecN (Recombination protein N)
MIELLRIQNVAVVESAELEFGEGLNVLTGETGAGKSVILGALSLLSGGRASPELIREGAEEAVVEAIFRTEALPALEAELSARGLSIEEHSVVLRRTVSRTGRSRARIGGQLVPVGVLSELFSGRFEISSQHASQSLLSAETQSLLLDASANLLPLRESVAEGAADLRRMDEEIEGLRAAGEERVRQQDFLAYQVHEIDEAKLMVGERGQLEAERLRLANVERLATEVQRSAQCFVGSGTTYGSQEGRAALVLVGEAARSIEGLAEFDPALAELSRRLDEMQVEAQDIAGELESYAADLELDPNRLEDIEERMAQLEQLGRKYGGSEEEILAFRDRAAEELAAVEGADERLVELQATREAAASALKTKARELSGKRAKAAKVLEKKVQASLTELAMPAARFSAALQPLDLSAGSVCGPHGLEKTEFLFAANEGATPRPLRKVASGGELSRVFLAVKNVLRAAADGLVLVFDEVDTGIGGGVAERVGRLLVELAREHQVLCITHLPQIAALGEIHFVIEKRSVGRKGQGKAQTGVTRVTKNERVEEIARMAGGEEVEDATRKHASALLAAAVTIRK